MKVKKAVSGGVLAQGHPRGRPTSRMSRLAWPWRPWRPRCTGSADGEGCAGGETPCHRVSLTLDPILRVTLAGVTKTLYFLCHGGTHHLKLGES